MQNLPMAKAIFFDAGAPRSGEKGKSPPWPSWVAFSIADVAIAQLAVTRP